jgi:hypothetical protein
LLRAQALDDTAMLRIRAGRTSGGSGMFEAKCVDAVHTVGVPGEADSATRVVVEERVDDCR